MDLQFHNVEFMTAKEKELVFKQWRRFLDSEFEEAKFTKRLYEHLSLHCGFIAHYNARGFYGVYFNGDLEDLKRFFSHFEPDSNYYHEDYTDLQKAMSDVYLEKKDKIFNEAQETNDNRFELLKEIVKRAEIDVDFRNKALNQLFS